MKRPFGSINALTSFLWRSPKQRGGAVEPGLLADWLDEGGLDGASVTYQGGAEPSATLLMVGREQLRGDAREYTVDAFALPSAECPAWLREALHEALSGATYGPDVCGDLGRDEWLAAVWIAVLCARGPGVMTQLADALEEMQRAGVALDAAELALCVGAWSKHQLEDGEALGSAVDGVYTICLRDDLGGA
ncbi:MAG: hypothetical protein H6713_28405 [Myxococcales bacterium]|nr:hypothetical protein [Myxococcales bacterium]MCB9753883.1 hypothetical protein [Myxococcales bacterium]